MTAYVACTIVARNYIAQARVLHESFRRFNADIDFVTLLVDGIESDRETEGIGEVALPGDLGLEESTLDVMATIYDVMEFSTSLKPALLMHLIRRGARAALYFDPDIEVFDALGSLFEQSEASGVFLTPHVLSPMPSDGKDVSERSIMLAGIFNLGFIGVGAGAYGFLTWWNDRLRYDAISDPGNALFTDQRWIDWVPALFSHHISRDPGLNVAHWNLHERPIAGTDGRLVAGGAPLRFLHFSGYDYRTPWLLSKHTRANPRVLLSDQPDLRRLCDLYGESLVRHGIAELSALSYRNRELPNGLMLGLPIRRLVRAVVSGEVDVDTVPPLAFAEPDRFVDWLVKPAFGAARARLTPLELALWLARADLQSAFPDIAAVSGGAYKEWFAADPEAVAATDAVLLVVGRGSADLDGGGEVPAPAIARNWIVVSLAEIGSESGEVADRIVNAFIASGAVTEQEGSSLFSPGESAVVDPEVVTLIVDARTTPPTNVIAALGRISSRVILVAMGTRSEVERSDWLEVDVDTFLVVEAVDPDRLSAPFERESVLPFPVFPSESSRTVSRSVLGLPADRRVVFLDIEADEALDESGALRAMTAFGRIAEDVRTAVLVVPLGGLPVAERERARASAQANGATFFLEDELTPGQKQGIVAAATLVVALHSEPRFGLAVAFAAENGVGVVSNGPTLESPEAEEMALANSFRTLLTDETALTALAEFTRDDVARFRSLAETADRVLELVALPDGERK